MDYKYSNMSMLELHDKYYSIWQDLGDEYIGAYIRYINSRGLSVADVPDEVREVRDKWTKYSLSDRVKVGWVRETIDNWKNKSVREKKQEMFDFGGFESRILKLATKIKMAQERARNENSKGVVNDKVKPLKARLWPNSIGAIQMNPDYDKTPKDRGEGYRKYVEWITKKKTKKVVAQMQPIIPDQPTTIQVSDPLLANALNLARQIASGIVSKAESAISEGGKRIGITVEMDTGATTGGVAELQTQTMPDGTVRHLRRIGINMSGTYAAEMYNAMQKYPNIDGYTAQLITAAYVLVHELAHHASGEQLAVESEAGIAADNFLQQAKQTLLVK